MSSAHEPKIGFDHHSTDFGEDQPAKLAELRGRCPMGHTEAHGGYWVASAAGAVFAYGDAPNDGSMVGNHLNSSIIAGTGF